MSTFGSNKLGSSVVGAGSQFDKAAYSAYEKVKSERDALKESEIVYKRRNDVLEVEKEELLKSYQNIYDENKVLRSKVEHGPDAQRIRKFREEIRRLEGKTESLKATISLLEDDRETLQKNLVIVTEEKKRLEDAYKMERGLHMDKRTDLEKDNDSLTEKLEKLETQNKEYEHRVKQSQGESDGMTDRYKSIRAENLKLETKFRKQKNEMDEELREAKTTNNEMAKEIIHLKMKVSKLESELHSSKLDYEAAKKQIDWHSKELDIFKTQTMQLKRNVNYKEREYYRLEDELKSAEGMIDVAHTHGFDAVLSERKALRRKEQLHNKRIADLEAQVEELCRESAVLDKEVNDYRMKTETLALENSNLKYSEGALKRRIEILEDANVELDKQGQFLLKSTKGFRVSMGNQNVKPLEKENQSLKHQIGYLEDENKKMQRRIRTLTNKPYAPSSRDDGHLYAPSRTSRKLIRADFISNYRPSKGATYSSKSRQTQSLPDI